LTSIAEVLNKNKMRSKLLNKIGGGKEINLDDLVFTSKELMDIFSKHNNPIVRE